jgi:hypothetical protein
LRTFENISDIRNDLKEWFRYYYHERFHQALENWTPGEIYFKEQALAKAA